MRRVLLVVMVLLLAGHVDGHTHEAHRAPAQRAQAARLGEGVQSFERGTPELLEPGAHRVEDRMR